MQARHSAAHPYEACQPDTQLTQLHIYLSLLSLIGEKGYQNHLLLNIPWCAAAPTSCTVCVRVVGCFLIDDLWPEFRAVALPQCHRT